MLTDPGSHLLNKFFAPLDVLRQRLEARLHADGDSRVTGRDAVFDDAPYVTPPRPVDVESGFVSPEERAQFSTE